MRGKRLMSIIPHQGMPARLRPSSPCPNLLLNYGRSVRNQPCQPVLNQRVSVPVTEVMVLVQALFDVLLKSH